MSADQFGQTDFNRTVTLEVRDNLASLYVLLDKLYRRPANGARPTPPTSPPPWRGSSAPSRSRPPPGLSGLRDIQILAVSLDPNYSGDRVAAFIYGLADTIIAAHNGKTWLYVSDALDGQVNAARNVEPPPGCWRRAITARASRCCWPTRCRRTPPTSASNASSAPSSSVGWT